MVNMAAITLGPDLVIHEKVTLGSDHSLLVFTLNVPTDCLKAPFSRINVINLMKRGQGAYRPAIKEREGAVNGRLTELLQQAMIDQTSGVPLTWEESGHIVNSASTMITEWILDAAEQAGGRLQFKGGFTGEKVDTPHLTALKTPLCGDLSVDANKIYRAAVRRHRTRSFRRYADALNKTPMPAAKIFSCQNSRRTRSHCALDPSKLPEYAAHFATTFGHAPTGTRAPNEEFLEDTDPPTPTTYRPL
ncbi:hypothetical protein HDU67_009145 [Dinochytrium kinnereticum]|nr:hypothetical protein HDU67_009145 [Dinochytrium kinnereticum]